MQYVRVFIATKQPSMQKEYKTFINFCVLGICYQCVCLILCRLYRFYFVSRSGNELKLQIDIGFSWVWFAPYRRDFSCYTRSYQVLETIKRNHGSSLCLSVLSCFGINICKDGFRKY